MQILKQSTAATIYVGPVLDSTGAAVTNAVVGDFRIVKNGTAATLSGATVTHDANGYYTIALTTSNTDTVGRLTISVGNTAQSMATHRYTVLVASVFDALITNATNATGGLLTATASVTTLAGDIATRTNITSASGVTLAATTHTGAVIPTVTSVTNRVTANTDQLAGQTVTAAAGVTFPSSVASPTNITAGTITTVTSVTNRVTANADQWGGVAVTGMPMATYTQPTGFLAATFPTTVASTTNITTVGAVSGSVGSISGVAFPTNFALLGINLSGHISRVVLVDTTTTNSDMRGTDGAALATHWTATRAGYLDSVLIAANSNQRTVQVTGSQHVAADIHELQAGVITAGDFSAGAIDANALAADASDEIAIAVRTNLATELGRIDVTIGSRATQTSVDTLDDYVDTEVAAIKAKTDNLPASPAAVGDIPTTTQIADMVLSRSITNTEASAGEYTLTTVVLAMLESSISGSTWTIRKTGGTTHATKTVTLDAAADPITGVT